MAEVKKSIEVHVAEVVRHNGPILLPEHMTVPDAITVLQRLEEYDKMKVALSEAVPAFVWDGALAMQKAIIEQFGIAMQVPTPGMWGDNPPKMISVEISPDQTVKVPWGRFSLPGIKGWVNTGYTQDSDGVVIFQASAEVQKKHEPNIKKLFDRVREIALSESIYRGRAFQITFMDGEENMLPIPNISFFKMQEIPPIFSRDLERAIETNLLAPIRYTNQVRAAGIPLKRGALLAGVYGTGKTLTAGMIAREAIANKWTFVYVKDVAELAHALRFASRFQPAVVFAEDVDRAAGIERNNDVNNLLNTLDGIGSKAGEIMTVLTSNHPESISQAMRRPGRIDVVLEVRPPDAEAAQRLMKYYSSGLLLENADLRLAGELLNGQIPAVIREVVERAKLEAINRSGGSSQQLSGDDLAAAATVLLAEDKLFRRESPSPQHVMATNLSNRIMEFANHAE